MKNHVISVDTVRAGRRRMLGAIAAATSPAIVPGAALAAGDGGLRRPGVDRGLRAAEGLRYREGWLLAQSDR